MWYVVQVPTGREEFLCRLIRRVAEESEQLERSEGEAMDCRDGHAPGEAPARGPYAADARPPVTPYLSEAFVPTAEFERKVRGEWTRLRRPLFPGYIVVDTGDADRLRRVLFRVPEFTRLLRMGEQFTPLDELDRALITTYADKGTRCVGLSTAVMEGDRVRVVSGPLRGREGDIKEVNRRSGIALLEVQMFGRTTTAKVGLAIVSKRNAQRGSSERE